ncbi:MAG: hypothetical protein KAQ68_11650 [Clostridiales bacterium]|nr:hypothetical protein [Clostridiales bacterium]
MNEKTYKILGYVARSVWFITRIVVACVVIVALMIVGYVIARDSANVYIIATEGMDLRAGVILKTEKDSSDLYKYFSGTFVTNDTEQKSSRYDEYFIRDYEYNLIIKSLWCNPWEGTADVVVIESIPVIDGEKPARNEEDKAESPPEWPRREFRISLIYENDKWLIHEITILEHLEPASTPTDEPEISPTPEGMTPTPYPEAITTQSTSP